MFNPDFDPLQLLHDLQKIQFEQAENLVKVSEWMVSVSTASTAQSTQLDHMFSMLSEMNKQMLFIDQRIKLLEQHVLKSINNTEISSQQ